MNAFKKLYSWFYWLLNKPDYSNRAYKPYEIIQYRDEYLVADEDGTLENMSFGSKKEAIKFASETDSPNEDYIDEDLRAVLKIIHSIPKGDKNE